MSSKKGKYAFRLHQDIRFWLIIIALLLLLWLATQPQAYISPAS